MKPLPPSRHAGKARLETRPGLSLRLLLVLLPALAVESCLTGDSVFPATSIQVRETETVAIETSPEVLIQRWPEFLLIESPDRLLWGQDNEVLRVTASAKGLGFDTARALDFGQGLDRLVAADRAPGGNLVVLDSSGRVAVYDPTSSRQWTFATSSGGQAGALTATAGGIYLLLQGEDHGRKAVSKYTLTGKEVGSWGKIPDNAWIQASLKGGGIAACPDGSVFLSYINSPQIMRLESRSKTPLVPIGGVPDSFEALPSGEIQRALRASNQQRSVSPLVKLGLGASRVMALFCSDDGFLFRQVAGPNGVGASIEVWNPRRETLVGVLPVSDGILLDIKAQTLYLGRQEGTGGRFLLEKVHYELPDSVQ